MLVNGVWKENWQPVQAQDEQGRFIRQSSSFRNWITPDGSAGITGEGGFKAEAGRYHLYVGYICPWASRTLMVRQFKKLEDIISITIVNPKLTDQGWAFGGFPDAVGEVFQNFQYMHQLYSFADADFTGRATVPVLWDKQRECIVNNESADIVKMLNSAFVNIAEVTPDISPDELQDDINELNAYLYESLNNGVYKAGFATTQQAYEEAYLSVFSALDKMEERLGDGRQYLFGDVFTESDIRLFVTLIRFDAAYHGLFKCNRNTIKDMPFLYAYMRRILVMPGMEETVNLEHIKAGYYSIKALNPTGIVPLGPKF